MKHLLIFAMALLLGNVVAYAQLDLPAVAGNPRATVSEEVGITSITITYARALITLKQADLALKLMLENQKKHGDNFVVNSGLMRAYSAKGNYPKAIEFADKAIAQAPNDQQKKATEDLKTQLKGNKDIN